MLTTYNFSAFNEGASYIMTAFSETEKNSASAAIPQHEKKSEKNRKKLWIKSLLGSK
jgi:hypothetical protein